MKLHEIFEPEQKTLYTQTPLNSLAMNKKPNIGKGFFSSVFPHKDEHMVTKISNSPTHANIDGYWKYVNELIKSNIWSSNPFFPRIYSIKKIQNSDDDEFIYSGVMEKLIEYKDIEPDVLCEYIKTIVEYPTVNAEIIKIERSQTAKYLMNRVGDVLALNMINLNSNEIKNDQLIEALEWFKKSRLTSDLDIHADNMMFRRGKTGIQLVITDPLAS